MTTTTAAKSGTTIVSFWIPAAAGAVVEEDDEGKTDEALSPLLLTQLLPLERRLFQIVSLVAVVVFSAAVSSAW